MTWAYVFGFVLIIIRLLLCWGNVMDLGLINILIENTFLALSHTFLKGGLNHWGSASLTFNRLFSACNAWNVAYYRVWHWECFPLHYSSGQYATEQKVCILTMVSLVVSGRPNKWKTFHFISHVFCVCLEGNVLNPAKPSPRSLGDYNPTPTWSGESIKSLNARRGGRKCPRGKERENKQRRTITGKHEHNQKAGSWAAKRIWGVRISLL